MAEGEMLKGDKLILRGLKFHGFHGVKEEEQKLGQKFLVDVDAWMDLRKPGQSDKLSDTISYTEIYRWAVALNVNHLRNLHDNIGILVRFSSKHHIHTVL